MPVTRLKTHTKDLSKEERKRQESTLPKITIKKKADPATILFPLTDCPYCAVFGQHRRLYPLDKTLRKGAQGYFSCRPRELFQCKKCFLKVVMNCWPDGHCLVLWRFDPVDPVTKEEEK